MTKRHQVGIFPPISVHIFSNFFIWFYESATFVISCRYFSRHSNLDHFR